MYLRLLTRNAAILSRKHDRRLIQEESVNIEKDFGRRSLQTLDEGSQEQPDVLATGYQEIETEESHNSWQADEFDNEELQREQEELASSSACEKLYNTILGNCNSCMRMMELYRQGVAYGTGEWKKLTSHQKIYTPVRIVNVYIMCIIS
jgi:hypothetical protein